MISKFSIIICRHYFVLLFLFYCCFSSLICLIGAFYRVTFPQTLNLNSFIKETDTTTTSTFARTNSSPNNCDTTSSEHGSVESAIKCDDCSTTDSGSILEEEVGAASLSSMNHKSDMYGQEDDEGIDMSSNTEAKSMLTNEPGPYNYELFSIMIHSGSASGGHYYAYIKDFETGQWHCFNDQSVSTVSTELPLIPTVISFRLL